MALAYLRDVVTLQLDPARCTGCRACLDVCPHGVLAAHERIVRIVARDACMECGACARNCAYDAIQVQAGVGCAAAVINAALGRTNAGCCGVDPSSEQSTTPTCGPGCC